MHSFSIKHIYCLLLLCPIRNLHQESFWSPFLCEWLPLVVANPFVSVFRAEQKRREARRGHQEDGGPVRLRPPRELPKRGCGGALSAPLSHSLFSPRHQPCCTLPPSTVVSVVKHCLLSLRISPCISFISFCHFLHSD